MSKSRYESFEEFWPAYLREHRSRAIRTVHVTGTGVALACAAAGLFTRQRWLLLVAPLAAYGPAWVAHWLTEGRPAARLDDAGYRLLADLLLLRMTLEGTIEAELARVLDEEVAPDTADAFNEIRMNMATDNTLH